MLNGATRLYVGAIREAFEESGLLLAQTATGQPVASSPALSLARDDLNNGTRSFSEILKDLDLSLPLGRLRYAAHWITPPVEGRRFDTRFFTCCAPENQQASFDPRETSAGAWLSVNEVLARHQAEDLKLAPPTYCVLLDLRPADTMAAMLAAAHDRPVVPVLPEIASRRRRTNAAATGRSTIHRCCRCSIH